MQLWLSFDLAISIYISLTVYQNFKKNAQSNTFVEIDHEIIFTVILLPSAEWLKKGSCQLQVKVCARSTG